MTLVAGGRIAIGGAVLGATLGVASGAAAQTKPERDAPAAQLDLEWSAPPGCPSREEVLGRIRALSGSALDETGGLSAEGRITPVGGRYRLTLVVPDGTGVRERVIAADACADLAGAAAVSLALLLGIELAEGPPPIEERPEAPAMDARAPSEPASGDLPQRDRDRLALVMRAPVLAADIGPLPRFEAGGGLGVGVRHGPWRVLFTGILWAPQSVAAPGDDPVGADLQRVSAQAAACRGWRFGHLELAPCAGLALELVGARGYGPDVSPRTSWTAWPAPSVGAVAYGSVSKSLMVFVGVSGAVELAHPRVVIHGIGEVARLGPAAAGATLGLEWIF